MKTIHPLPLLLVLTAPAAGAQEFTFSINWRGPSVAVQSTSPPGFFLNEADILTFGPGSPGFGTLQAPSYSLFGAQLGLNQYSNCLNHPQNDPCGIEVDAISQGRDALLFDDNPGPGAGLPPLDEVWLSVDERAVGRSTSAFGADSGTESGAVADASADVFLAFGIGIAPVGPGGAPGTNAGVFDGNGLRSTSQFVYPGIGLIEPNIPGAIPATGDNLDGLDIGAVAGFPSSGVYFSLDASFPDPALPALFNSGSAAIQGVNSGDVLRTIAPGTPPVVFAASTTLGLDLTAAGFNSDDLDALVLAENGDGVFQPSKTPYDWTDGSTDMLLFSVRRGSAVIGRMDSILGLPIEEGDILTTPKPTSMGGLSIFPGIMWSAEALGLRTSRTHGVMFGDDLDAMDFEAAACFDCNNNGIEDAVDIATGASSDENRDGVPDECEKALEFCFCPDTVAPCSNDALLAGCSNSATAGARMYATGTTSVGADDLVLVTDGLPANKPGLYYMGGAGIALPLGDGIRCVGSGGQGVFRYGVQNSGPSGVFTVGPGVSALSCSLFNQNGCIDPGDTWYLQAWYRDPTGPCGGGFNFSNAVRVQFEM